MTNLLLEYHSNPYVWTTITSRKNRNTMKKNNKNIWIDILLRKGNGFANILLGFLNLHEFVELRCTSRILDKFVLYYIQNTKIYDPSTPVYDIMNFLILFPYATAIILPIKYTNYTLLSANIFIGKNINTMDLYGCDFTKIPDFNPANFKGVKTLLLNYCTINNDDFFSCMQEVETLSLSQAIIYTTGPNCFAYLQNISYLDISSVNIESMQDCWEYLDGITTLVAKYCSDITDHAINVLTRSGCLYRLDITGCMNTNLTTASTIALKSIPELIVRGCIIEFECKMDCYMCQNSIDIHNEDRHLATICTQNFITCKDCDLKILRKNQRRHRKRCMNRSIICTLCSDTDPYHKKDSCFHLQNYDENSLRCTKSTLEIELENLQQEVNNILFDACNQRLNLRQLPIPLKHQLFIDQMKINVSNHTNKKLKQLYVECNMLKQLLVMRRKHKKHIEIIFEDINDQIRQEDEDYYRYQSYYDDMDEERRQQRRDRW
jgi:hypothetical protein